MLGMTVFSETRKGYPEGSRGGAEISSNAKSMQCVKRRGVVHTGNVHGWLTTFPESANISHIGDCGR